MARRHRNTFIAFDPRMAVQMISRKGREDF
jgi:hypothetical protein